MQNTMKVIAFGTRGSIAISNSQSAATGGNTTCFEVVSECLPPGMHLAIDAGTGFVPMGWKYLSEMANGLKYLLLFTHYHWDHILGLTLSPPTFIDSIPMTLVGPVDASKGPEDMVKHLFQRPYFPVDARQIAHKMTYKPLEDFEVTVMAIHPAGGLEVFRRDRYMELIANKRQLPFGRGKSFPMDECLIITMQPAFHSNARCISYRFDERPSGKVFVLLTDHEDQASVPVALRNHLKGADLLIVDTQYDAVTYAKTTGGYGHGTPRGAMKLGLIAGAKQIGLTHHDPRSVDAKINGVILPEATNQLAILRADEDFLRDNTIDERITTDQNVMICYDYMEMQV